MLSAILDGEALAVSLEHRMVCKSCQADKAREFDAEINIHFPGLKLLNGQAAVLVFPRIAVCLECGFSEFSIPETELQLFREIDSTAA